MEDTPRPLPRPTCHWPRTRGPHLIHTLTRAHVTENPMRCPPLPQPIARQPPWQGAWTPPSEIPCPLQRLVRASHSRVSKLSIGSFPREFLLNFLFIFLLFSRLLEEWGLRRRVSEKIKRRLRLSDDLTLWHRFNLTFSLSLSLSLSQRAAERQVWVVLLLAFELRL